MATRRKGNRPRKGAMLCVAKLISVLFSSPFSCGGGRVGEGNELHLHCGKRTVRRRWSRGTGNGGGAILSVAEGTSPEGTLPVQQWNVRFLRNCTKGNRCGTNWMGFQYGVGDPKHAFCGSSKFSRKVQFVDSLDELSEWIPVEQVHIPDCVRQLDLPKSRSWS